MAVLYWFLQVYFRCHGIEIGSSSCAKLDHKLYGLTVCRFVLCFRPPEPVASSKQTAVHTFHWLTLPPSAVSWYRQTASVISAAAGERSVSTGSCHMVGKLV